MSNTKNSHSVKLTIISLIGIILLSGCGRFVSGNLRESPYTFDKKSEKKYSITVIGVSSAVHYKDYNQRDFSRTYEGSGIHIKNVAYYYKYSYPGSDLLSELESSGYFSDIWYLNNNYYCHYEKDSPDKIELKKDSDGNISEKEIFSKCKTDYILLVGDVHNTLPLRSSYVYNSSEGKAWTRDFDILSILSLPFNIATLSIIPGSTSIETFTDYAILKADGTCIGDGEIRNDGRDYMSCMLSPFYLFAGETYSQGNSDSYITGKTSVVQANITVKKVVDHIEQNNK